MVGTGIDEGLLNNAKAAAAAEGWSLSKLLEEALKEYLDRHRGLRTGSAVASTWGAFEADGPLLQALMEEESVLDS